MSKKSKQLSSSFSTGGGGVLFEANVQALFAVLMLTGGYAPSLPPLPIVKLKLQGRSEGYETDDLIVFMENADGTRQQKLLGQVKHTIKITANDPDFSEVIQSAWNDFNNLNLFARRKDAIALMTGPLSASDIAGARGVLELARQRESVEEFLRDMSTSKLTSNNQRTKLTAFKRQLSKANQGKPLSNEELHQFLRHFHILSFDLDLKAGTTLSLLHSLIGQYSLDNVGGLWARVLEEVQFSNKHGGSLTKTNLPEELQVAFQRQFATVPAQFSDPTTSHPNWNNLPYPSTLAIANLLGGWNEKHDADISTVGAVVGEDFGLWIVKLQEILLHPNSPVNLRNGDWQVTHRKEIWHSLGERLFDKEIDAFHLSAISTLTEPDPKFDLPPGERFLAQIRGKTPSHSRELKRGLAEGLALLGTYSSALTHCSQNKGSIVATLSVREIFRNADWTRWGSLNRLLPLLAEADPNEFLTAVDHALGEENCPFDELFRQEGDGLTGENYMTGLLWALEALAWDEHLLIRVCVLLGELASRDPGGTSANRPFHSLVGILLPLMHQTTASLDKRTAAVGAIQKELPNIAWRLILSLLPGRQRPFVTSNKPIFRMVIPEAPTSFDQNEYQADASAYAAMAITLAGDEISKLMQLIERAENLPLACLDQLLDIVSSESMTFADLDKLKIWNRLTQMSDKQKRFAGAKEAIVELISKIDRVASKLAPRSPLEIYQELFSKNFLYRDREGTWAERTARLEEQRRQGMLEILSFGGIPSLIEFAKFVDLPGSVGYTFGTLDQADLDSSVLESLLEDGAHKLNAFADSYLRAKLQAKDWKWIDGIDSSHWSQNHIVTFLSVLPFTPETWERAARLLGGSEDKYWKAVNPNPYETNDVSIAVDKLIEHGRPGLAIACLNRSLQDKGQLDVDTSARALLAAVATESHAKSMDPYEAVEIIKALQNDPATNEQDLFEIEWRYLEVMDRDLGVSPKLLESKLSSDPTFFCDLMKLLYHSNKLPRPDKEPTQQQRLLARNASILLREWRTPPGKQKDGSFAPKEFETWLDRTKALCEETGHLAVAMTHVGGVLLYTPEDPSGLWINKAVAEALNRRDAAKMREGFSLQIVNSRGVHWVDPTGKPEKDLALQYRQKSEDVENAGFQRLAATLRAVAEGYDREADNVISDATRWSS